MVWNLKKHLILFCEQYLIHILYLEVLAAFSQTVIIVSSLFLSVGFSSKCSDSFCVLQLGDSFLHGNKGDQLPFTSYVW